MRPALRLLEPELVDRIVDEAMDLLATQGVLIEEAHARERLAPYGLVPDADRRLRLPRATVERALATAPSSIALYGRDGELAATLEGDEVHFVPASSALRILDHRSGEMRPPTSADFIEYVKLGDGLKNIAYLSTAFIPAEVPQELADAWRLYLVLAHSRRPVVSGAFTAWGVERMAEMMGMFRSSRQELIEKPMSIFTCCPNTPLRWGEDPISNLVDCAENGIPVEIVPVLLLGMISPATTVGALVLHTAEVLSGLTVAQQVRPGAPILFGGAPATFHMQLMTNPMTAVEALQIDCAYARIAKRLKLPCQAYMALSDSKFNDPQAGFESGVGAFLAALAGINSVSGPGMLDYVNCFSFEKLGFDDEVAAHALRFVRPVEPKDDLPAAALMEELVRDKHLLTAEHTLEHWPRELYMPGPMVDRTNWDQWQVAGSNDWKARAQEMIAERLSAYEEEPLPAKVHEEIRRLFEATRREPGAPLPDFPRPM